MQGNRIEMSTLKGLHGLYEERATFLREMMRYSVDDERSTIAYKNALAQDDKIDSKFAELRTDENWGSLAFLRKLLESVYALGFSRYVECCKIYGFEVV